MDPALNQISRGAHVHHFGRAGIADRAGAADHQDRFRRDPRRRVVDLLVIFLRPVEDDRWSFERIGIVRLGQVTLAEFVGDHRTLHDRGVE